MPLLGAAAPSVEAYWIAPGAMPRLLPAAGSSPRPPAAIARRLAEGEDPGDVAADLLRLRTGRPGVHVGLWVPDRATGSAARLALLQATAADFLVCDPHRPDAGAIRPDLLDPDRLPHLARIWFAAFHPDLPELARRFFGAMHDPALNHIGIPRIASALGCSHRSLSRQFESLPAVTPGRVRMLGRLVCVAVGVARDPDHTVGWHAGGQAFLEYPDFYRAFRRFFGLKPTDATDLMGPAELWHRWADRFIA